MLDKFCLRPVRESDREIILLWRNSDRIRRNMYRDHVISIEEHHTWFSRMRKDDTLDYLVLEFSGQPVGLSYFTRIDTVNHHCEWGFYLGEDDLPRGSGTIMGYLSLRYMFDDRNMRKIYGEVLSYNDKSQKFFQRLGFTCDGRLREHIARDDRFLDVVLYSQLHQEWTIKYRKIVESLVNRLETVQP